jgi:predicted alpha/beta superfamily hydrolase
VKPFIDSRYRTLPHDSGLGGSSLGGLLTMYLGLRYPVVFDRLAVMSPSVWWDERRLLADVAAAPGRTRARIWLDIGTDEGRDPAAPVADARMLRDALVAKGWVLGQDLAYTEDPGAKHGEEAWARRFPQALQFLYGVK